MILVLSLTIAALYGMGAYLILQRSLSRIVIGLAMFGHGANLLLLAAGGRTGAPPFAGVDAQTAADPLPQALTLTAVVITFAVTAFLLALSYRSWMQAGNDEVEDDMEDRRIVRRRRELDEERARHHAAAELAGQLDPAGVMDPITNDVERER